MTKKKDSGKKPAVKPPNDQSIKKSGPRKHTREKLSEAEHGQAWERGESVECAPDETDPDQED